MSVAVVIQHASRMHRNWVLSVACLAVQYFNMLSVKQHDFRDKVHVHKMSVFIFCTMCVWNISHSKKNWARWHKCSNVFMQSTYYFCQTLMKLESSWQIFEKSSNIKFHENPSSGCWVVSCKWTDEQTCWN
jgi:hypothetical protein